MTAGGAGAGAGAGSVAATSAGGAAAGASSALESVEFYFDTSAGVDRSLRFVSVCRSPPVPYSHTALLLAATLCNAFCPWRATTCGATGTLSAGRAARLGLWRRHSWQLADCCCVSTHCLLPRYECVSTAVAIPAPLPEASLVRASCSSSTTPALASCRCRSCGSMYSHRCECSPPWTPSCTLLPRPQVRHHSSFFVRSLRVDPVSVSLLHLSGGALLNAIHAAALRSGDRQAQRVARFLLERAAEPYLGMVEQWIYHGIVTDAHEEFMVRLPLLHSQAMVPLTQPPTVAWGSLTCR